MTINTTARNTVIRDSFKRSAEKKLAKLDRFFGDEVIAHVTVSNDSAGETVEVAIKANNMNFRAERTTRDRLDSLDLVVDALFRQIVKNKSKLEKRLHKKAFTQGYDDDYIGAEDSYKLVKTKQVDIKPMDVEEAILQMNLVGHSFYMFRNSDGGQVSVVYRRNDGDYGLLEAIGS